MNAGRPIGFPGEFPLDEMPAQMGHESVRSGYQHQIEPMDHRHPLRDNWSCSQLIVMTIYHNGNNMVGIL